MWFDILFCFRDLLEAPPLQMLDGDVVDEVVCVICVNVHHHSSMMILMNYYEYKNHDNAL